MVIPLRFAVIAFCFSIWIKVKCSLPEESLLY